MNKKLKSERKPLKTQLLKWIGNKQKFAPLIIKSFPSDFNRYYEPFLGSGAVMAELSPKEGYGSDNLEPLIDIFKTLKNNPNLLKNWYKSRWLLANGSLKKDGYYKIRSSFNKKHNPRDFLFLARSCYGGVIRFRKEDGYMSTPVGVHEPISPTSFNKRVDIWHKRLRNCEFKHMDYKEAMSLATKGDMVYCDPPYDFSQSILYGGQNFNLDELYDEISKCKKRGVKVALSIDGIKKSGKEMCDINPPDNLFESEIYIDLGKSMLKRFQMHGKNLEKENVKDRLLLTY